MDNLPQNNLPYNNGSGGEHYNNPNGYSRQESRAGFSPSEIYNNAPRGSMPQYHYGVNQPVIDHQYMDARRQYRLARKMHSKSIKQLGNITGVALFILLLLSNLIGVLFYIPKFNSLYSGNFTFSTAFYVFYSVLTVGGSFYIVYRLFSKSKSPSKIEYNLPKDKVKSLLLVLMGFGGCLAANYITSILRFIGESVGVYSSYSAIDYPENIFDVFLMFVATSLIPALIEEYAFRGVLLGSLKKYGNAFAVIATSVVFAIFHANAVQIPFAFMCGLLLGYAVIASESIWVGVAIHAMTNAISCVSSAIILYVSEDFANSFYMILMPIGIILGIMCTVLYVSRYKDNGLLKTSGEGKELDLKAKLGKFFSAPAMIIACIFFIIMAIKTLTTTPTTY